MGRFLERVIAATVGSWLHNHFPLFADWLENKTGLLLVNGVVCVTAVVTIAIYSDLLKPSARFRDGIVGTAIVAAYLTCVGWSAWNLQGRIVLLLASDISASIVALGLRLALFPAEPPSRSPPRDLR